MVSQTGIWSPRGGRGFRCELQPHQCEGTELAAPPHRASVLWAVVMTLVPWGCHGTAGDGSRELDVRARGKTLGVSPSLLGKEPLQPQGRGLVPSTGPPTEAPTFHVLWRVEAEEENPGELPSHQVHFCKECFTSKLPRGAFPGDL